VQVPVPLQVLLPPRLEWPSAEHDGGTVQASPAWVWQALPFVAQSALVPQASSAQAVAQHTLSVPLLTQAPLAQSPGAVHFLPTARGILHSPPRQMKPAAQLVMALAAVQLVAHVLPVQAYPVMQATGAGGAQAPRPLQVLVGPLIMASMQVMATVQAVDVPASAQAPPPLHLPVFPQGAPGGQEVASRGLLPTGIAEHIPTLPATRQLLQPSVQAASQHTPSPEQILLVQSVFALQAWPFGSVVPHLLSTLRQVRPVVQSVSLVQVVRQDGLVALHT
jgi:hypothetical protein